MAEKSSSSKLPLYILIGVTVIGSIIVVVSMRMGTKMIEEVQEQEAANQSTEISEEQIQRDLAEIAANEVVEIEPAPAQEILFFEDEPTVETTSQHPLMKSRQPNRIIDASLNNLTKIVEADEAGGFINPMLSPDGLQIMLTRPGFQGIYLVPAKGGIPQLIANENAWGASWTPDGRIKVERRDGEVRYYTTDGILESAEQIDPSARPVFTEDDMVYVRAEPGTDPKPLTDNNDRYITPVASPAGDKVTFYGLYSGLYVTSSDGSGEPVFLGNGSNVQWNQDGSGFIYDQTVDDGHAMVEGDIYYYDVNTGDVTNLTSDIDMIGMNPTLGNDGNSVAFEVDGSIYTGTIN